MKIPALVDLQVNGQGGVDFSDPALTEEDFVRACRGILNSGTNAFVVTVVTSPVEVYKRNLPLMASIIKSEEFKGRVLGFHIEGPFISDRQGARGAHILRWIQKPDIELFDRMLQWSDNNIKMLTIAAELEGADKLCKYAAERNVCVSLGHQMALEDDIKKLSDSGAKCLTHLGNGVPSVVDRHNNPIWPALADDNLVAMIITDGHHLPASMIKTIIRSKGTDRVVVVSDQMSVVGLEPGKYHLFGDDAILTADGRLYNPNTGYLAASGCTMSQCVKYLASLNILTDDELAMAAYQNPLKLIKLTAEDLNTTGKDSP